MEELSRTDELRARALLHYNKCFTPNYGQRVMGQAFFGGKKIIFCRYGRNGGKSYGAAACGSKYGIQYDNKRIFFFAPKVKQVRQIYWKPKIIQEFIPDYFIKRTDQENLEIDLINGTYIKFDGSDADPDVVRGYKPDIVFADEWAQFKPYWQEAMFPNLIARNATLVVVGTPPEFPINEDGTKHHYVQFDEDCQKSAKESPDRVFWAWLPTWEANPAISKEALANEKKRLFDRNEDYVWFREYGAKIVSGSSRQIFPHFSKDAHIVSHESLLEKVNETPERYEFWAGADPGTRGTFAVVFMAVDHYASHIFWLDELYEQEASLTIAAEMNTQILEKCEAINPNLDEWNFICDNAGAPYIEESAAEPDNPIWWNATQKELNDKVNGISTIKTVFRDQMGCMSEECFSTSNEFLRYQRGKDGRIPKRNDHTIDVSRYIVKESGFDFNNKILAVPPELDPAEKAYLGNGEAKLKSWLGEDDFWDAIVEEFH